MKEKLGNVSLSNIIKVDKLGNTENKPDRGTVSNEMVDGWLDMPLFILKTDGSIMPTGYNGRNIHELLKEWLKN